MREERKERKSEKDEKLKVKVKVNAFRLLVQLLVHLTGYWPNRVKEEEDQ